MGAFKQYTIKNSTLSYKSLQEAKEGHFFIDSDLFNLSSDIFEECESEADMKELFKELSNFAFKNIKNIKLELSKKSLENG